MRRYESSGRWEIIMWHIQADWTNEDRRGEERREKLKRWRMLFIQLFLSAGIIHLVNSALSHRRWRCVEKVGDFFPTEGSRVTWQKSTSGASTVAQKEKLPSFILTVLDHFTDQLNSICCMLNWKNPGIYPMENSRVCSSRTETQKSWHSTFSSRETCQRSSCYYKYSAAAIAALTEATV